MGWGTEFKKIFLIKHGSLPNTRLHYVTDGQNSDTSALWKNHFSVQNFEKIFANKSSEVISPVISPR